ncbi:MAG: bifunctional oligoribonuclease/PAP phosphatase NrnA [Verrucomicrobiota bacterium]
MSLRTNTSFAHLAELFRAGSSFAVLSHYRPDGDAIGSSLALGMALKNLGKTVRIINEDPLPSTLKFLPGSELLEWAQPGQVIEVETAIAVDCANRERLGANALAALAGTKQWINIDHHVSNEGYGDLHHINPGAPATGEIMFDLLTEAGLPITPEIADNLYVAISTDTGSFQYSGTTARTYEIGAALIRAGVKVYDLARETYESFPLRRVELLRGLLNGMQITHNGRVASWGLTRELADSVGMKPEDAEGLIDHLRSIQGVIVAAAFEELPGDGDKIRLSLRSKDPSVDVGRVCARFGGGGHPMAAGARLAGPLSDAQSRIFQALNETFS